jgi:hypothetical protein
MFKKTVIFSCLSLISLSSLISADESISPKESAEIYSGGWTLGVMNDISFGNSRSFLTFGYINKCFLFDLGFNYDQGHLKKYDDVVSKWKILTLQSPLGLRNRIYKNLYVTYGITGSAPAGSVTLKNGYQIDDLVWTAGVFTGLDFQITRHFLLSAKISPYLYETTDLASSDRKSSRNIIFGSSSIGLAYVF